MSVSNSRQRRKQYRYKKESDKKFFLYVFFFHIFNTIGNFFTELFED